VILQSRAHAAQRDLARPARCPDAAAVIGKFVIAVDEDIDPTMPMRYLGMAYRCNPIRDTQWCPVASPATAAHRRQARAGLRHADRRHHEEPMPPFALPKRPYMENARALWERLGLPASSPRCRGSAIRWAKLDRGMG